MRAGRTVFVYLAKGTKLAIAFGKQKVVWNVYLAYN
jgi:hypothetical protein